MNLADVAKIPMRSEAEMRMVEIIVLKWRRPDIETKCAELIIANTSWPFKLVVYDNRPNTANTARIWNKLIRDATSDYICMIDSDAFVPACEPCWLTRMMSTFERPDCRLVVPMTDRCSTPQQRGQAESYGAVSRHDREWSGFCFLMRKSLLHEIGQFDEDFVGYGQDSEFSIRLARNGGGTYIRRDVFVQHLHGASFLTNQEYAAADRAYAQRLFMEKTAR